MKELHNQGKTIIVITHDMSLAAEYAKRCIIMSDGGILLEGTPKQIFVQTDKLTSTNLTPPTITQLFMRLSESYSVPQDILTVDEATQFFQRTLKSGG